MLYNVTYNVVYNVDVILWNLIKKKKKEDSYIFVCKLIRKFYSIVSR